MWPAWKGDEVVKHRIEVSDGFGAGDQATGGPARSKPKQTPPSTLVKIVGDPGPPLRMVKGDRIDVSDGETSDWTLWPGPKFPESQVGKAGNLMFKFERGIGADGLMVVVTPLRILH